MSADRGVLPLLIIGAGPHALTLVSALLVRDRTSVSESQRVHVQKWQEMTNTTARAWSPSDILVIDPAGSWLAAWTNNFRTLDIKYLRSVSTMGVLQIVTSYF